MKTPTLLLHALRDRFRLSVPVTNVATKYGFAFLVHPRDRRDVSKKYPFMRYLPSWCIDLFTRHLWPVVLSEVTGLRSLKTGEPVCGWVITIPLTAEQMTHDRELALARIREAGLLAQNMGAKIIGLGGLTSSFSKGGLDLTEHLKVGVTTGHAYTAHTVTSYMFAVEREFALDKAKIVVAIVGASGSIGSTCAKLLARAGYRHFILIDLERKHVHFPELMQEMIALEPKAVITTSSLVSAIRTADFIVAATNAPEEIITSKDLKPGAIIFDDAQPSDVAAEVLDNDAVLALEAGVISTPSVHSHFNFGLKAKTDNFCCMGEVLILAAEGWREHYVINRASLDAVDRIVELNRQLGFTISTFQNRKEIIPQTKRDRVKLLAQQNQRGL